jgi:hypothetical protein
MAETLEPENFSLSIFTLEADGKPVLAIAAKTAVQADQFCSDVRVRAVLREASLCEDHSILRIRMARNEERERFYTQREIGSAIGGLHAVYLA